MEPRAPPAAAVVSCVIVVVVGFVLAAVLDLDIVTVLTLLPLESQLLLALFYHRHSCNNKEIKHGTADNNSIHHNTC